MQVEIITWNEVFETGVEEIDDQHHRLINLINEFANTYVTNVSESEFEQLFNNLFDYAAFHFESEEAYWSANGVSQTNQEEHAHSHTLFVNQLTELAADHSSSLRARGERVLLFLVDWLVYHIINSDKRLVMVINNIQSGMTYSSAVLDAGKYIDVTMNVVLKTILNMYTALTKQAIDLLNERAARIELEHQLTELNQQEQAISDSIMTNMSGILVIYNPHTDQVIRANSAWYELSPAMQQQIIDLEWYKNCSQFTINTQTYLTTVIPLARYNILVAKDITEITQLSSDYHSALTSIIHAIVKTLELRDPYTAGHQSRVANLAKEIAIKLDLPEHEIEGIWLGACIHDIGKLAVPLELLVKPTKLSDAEYSVIKQHVEAGEAILTGIKFPWPLIDIVVQHHERLDGRGYPYGLSGTDICLGARIIAVVDTYDAMAYNRPYRTGLGPNLAITELENGRDIKYDGRVIDALLAIINQDPK